MCRERRPPLCPRPRTARGPPAPPAAAPDWQQGGGRSGGQRTAADLAVPPASPPPCGFLSPQPTRACSNATDAEESAPTWTGAEQQQQQERAEQHPWPPQPGEGSQRRRHSAGLRGHAPRPPGSRCPPACPLLRALPTPLLDARSLGFPFGLRRGVAWRGSARPAAGLCVAARPAHGHPLSRGGGPESPAWGRSEAAAGGGGGGGVDSAAAAGLGTTFYIWPLVWGPRGRCGRRRETPGGGPVAALALPRGGPGAAPRGGGGPRRTMHLGVKPRLRVFGPRPRPLCLPATVEDRATKAELRGPGCPRGPSPAGLFRIRGRRRRGGGGMVLRDVERPETFPLMAPAHPPPSLTRRGPVEGKLTIPTLEICQPDWRHVRVLSATFGDGSCPPCPPIRCSTGLKTASKSALKSTITFWGDVLFCCSS